jgi:hypothetical protein
MFDLPLGWLCDEKVIGVASGRGQLTIEHHSSYS